VKVFHFTNHYPGVHSLWGGAEQACKRTVEMLRDEQGVEQEIIFNPPDVATPTDPGVKYHAMTGIEGLVPIRMRALVNGIKTIFLPIDPVIYRKCIKLFKERRPDLVHLHNFKNLSISIASAAHRLGIPVVFSIYDYWIFCPKDNLFTTSWVPCAGTHGFRCLACYQPKGIAASWVTKTPLVARKMMFAGFVSSVDAYVVLSESSKQILRSRGGILESKISVIRQCLPLPVETACDPRGIVPCSVLYVAWVAAAKGAHVFVRAAQQVLEKIPEARFLLAGDINDFVFHKFLRDLIQQLKIESAVEILGKKPPAEVVRLIQTSEVVVIPEQWENMSPLFLTEAMAYGKPIVASDIGGLSELIQDGRNGLLARPTSPESFAEKVIFLIRNKEAAARMGEQAAIDIRDKFDPSQIRASTLALYRGLVTR
jgi:glycosyltransferase involved in cell wall biosynthesis